MATISKDTGSESQDTRLHMCEDFLYICWAVLKSSHTLRADKFIKEYNRKKTKWAPLSKSGLVWYLLGVIYL